MRKRLLFRPPSPAARNLFGQGAELQVERFEVVSADVRRR
jgi:hypothetical protein